MHLDDARNLKQRIRHAIAPPRTFAIGINLSQRDGHRVVILLSGEGDRSVLEHLEVRKILDAAKSDIDVEVTGSLTGASGRRRAAPTALLSIGAPIGHVAGGSGSLGCFAARRSDGRRGLVSCNHVIALADRGVDGDDVISPFRLRGGRAPRNRIATLDGAYPRLGGLGRKLTDCAFAPLADGILYDPALVEGGTLVAIPAEASEQLDVMKTGCMTGTTGGVVMKVEVDDVPVRYGAIKAFFNDVIQIGSVSPARFAEGGDSGALVYARGTFQPVGFVFATSDIGGPFNAGWTWAHPFGQVMNALEVEMIVR